MRRPKGGRFGITSDSPKVECLKKSSKRSFKRRLHNALGAKPYVVAPSLTHHGAMRWEVELEAVSMYCSRVNIGFIPCVLQNCVDSTMVASRNQAQI